MATNIILWIRTLIKESMEEIEEYETEVSFFCFFLQRFHNLKLLILLSESWKTDWKPWYSTMWYFNQEVGKYGKTQRGVPWISDQNPAWKYLVHNKPIFFPICYWIFFNWSKCVLHHVKSHWSNVSPNDTFILFGYLTIKTHFTWYTFRPNTDDSSESIVHKPNPMKFMKKSNFNHTLKGFIGGSVILILAILELGLFFGLDAHEDIGDSAEMISKLMNTIINLLGIFVIGYGITTLRHLQVNTVFEIRFLNTDTVFKI